MQSDLPHLVATVFNTPHLVHGAKLETILNAIGSRLLTGEVFSTEMPIERPSASARIDGRLVFENGGYLADEGIAVLPVMGTLVRRGSWLSSLSGMTSYASLGSAIAEMAGTPKVRGILLDIDSFGGEAGGCFDLVAAIKSAVVEAGKPLWAVANEAAASAAYAIASAATRIWVPQTGILGSIGVVAAHVDMTKADQMAGQKWTFIYAGDRKVDGNPHLPLSNAAKADEQADVDEMYAAFVNLVAANRGLSADQVRATQARIYRGARAVDIGLATDVGTLGEALTAFADHLNQPPTFIPAPFLATDQTQRKSLMANIVEPSGVPDLGLDADVAPDDESATAVETAAETDETTTPGEATSGAVAANPAADAERVRSCELARIGEQARKLGVSFNVVDAIERGVSPEAARASILEAAAAADAARETSTLVSVPTASDASNRDTIKAGYDRALEQQRRRFGLK